MFEAYFSLHWRFLMAEACDKTVLSWRCHTSLEKHLQGLPQGLYPIHPLELRDENG